GQRARSRSPPPCVGDLPNRLSEPHGTPYPSAVSKDWIPGGGPRRGRLRADQVRVPPEFVPACILIDEVAPGLSAGLARSLSSGRQSNLAPHTPRSIANSTMNRFLLGTFVLALLASQASAQSVVIVNGQKVAVPAKPGQKPLPPGYVPPSSTGSHTSFLVNG